MTTPLPIGIKIFLYICTMGQQVFISSNIFFINTFAKNSGKPYNKVQNRPLFKKMHDGVTVFVFQMSMFKGNPMCEVSLNSSGINKLAEVF